MRATGTAGGARVRWLVPVAVVALIAAAVGLGPVVTASAQPVLPPISATALLAKLARAHPAGLSGTLRQSADLGLPQLPAVDLGGGASPFALLSGEHTLRLWYAGTDRVRLQVFGDSTETDLIRDGTDLWTYTSRTNAVTHSTLAPTRKGAGLPLGSGPAGLLTTGLLASAALAALAPSTTVTVGAPVAVAGRPAYQLRLAPRSATSLIGAVTVAVDAETGAPLRLRVVPRGRHSPALDIGFTDVDTAAPSDAHFSFRPPPNAALRERPAPSFRLPGGPDPARVIGSGWNAVFVLPNVTVSKSLRPLLTATDPVPGGHLLRTSLFSALLTDDGHLVVGAVTPHTLLTAFRG